MSLFCLAPPAAFPLDAVLAYERVDGAQLTIFMDDTAVASSRSTLPITTTLGSSQVISLTNGLLASGSLRTGLTTFLDSGNDGSATATPTAPRSVLLVRGPDGVYDAQWFNTSDVAVLAELNALLNQILSLDTAVPGTTAEPEATPAVTPTDE